MINVFLRTYIKHRRNFTDLLLKVKRIADYAVEHKNSKLLTDNNVKHYWLHSDISNQIPRKYGRGNIKDATNVNLIIPNTERKNKYTTKKW